ncbi:bis(5'-nucleosyl)-tetraphosphatase (symmetrical) YqeK [Sporomusa sphaeroides DSM 2875]|jgi:predicted HD superfamily hydrolase involved in NAD metabolism|uniref:bis(5'-nucleosyl)-tetraphosphatase (symmetrical) YqeK n=1 Tax=Sporomusa sphaeroides TaxID=47679 RepID=UPI00202EC819|nr:bis(5'-nucleosyl)-tetraphosphatase (symmetrical) YqeK [Sporomusa sphaeroides]MCM0758307.1 bis(5'-nucleosyl)-tetraphosphatase (symmetrical) YqeK [Sporomusa sphaeroides DSM 2875]
MEYNQVMDKLSQVLSAKRFQHSLGVSQTAGKLAGRFGVDVQTARLAGLLHDCARNISSDSLLQKAEAFAIVMNDVERCQPVLLHAPVGAFLANTEYGVDDPDILAAIRLHTTGGRTMSTLAKIIYLADCIEPGRKFPGVDKLRRLADADLNAALLAAFDQSLYYVIEQGLLIHPATIEGRNYLLQR